MHATRWQQSGHDRLYIRDAEGRELGWYDLVARRAHPVSEEVELHLWVTLQLWRRSGGSSTQPQTQPHPPAQLPRQLSWAEFPYPPPTPTPTPTPTMQAQPLTPPPPQQVRLDFPPPTTEPVRDLLTNEPGEQLREQIAAAHAAGQRPTLLRRFRYGRHAYSSWEKGAIGERLVAEELDTATRGSGWAATRSWSTAPASPTCATAATRRGGRAGCCRRRSASTSPCRV